MEGNLKLLELSPAFYSAFYDEEIYLVPKKYKIAEKKLTEYTAEESVVVYGENRPIFMGDKNSGLLLLFSYAGRKELPVKDKMFLEKILAAVGITFGATAWLNMIDYPETTFAELANSPKVKSIIAFDIKNTFFPDLPFGEPVLYNKKNIIIYHSLEAIAEDAEKKKVLWGGLKKVFGK